MRISYLLPRCTPDNSHGRYVIELARRLGGEHQVTVCAGAFWPPIRTLVRCHFLPVPIRPAVARLATLWTASVLATRRWPSDIVHIQGADAPVGNVITAHCCNAAMRTAASHGARLRRRLNYAIGAIVEKYCMSNPSARRIIAVSHKVKSDLDREYNIDPRRMLVIPHGVDGQIFNPNLRAQCRDSVRTRLSIALDAFVVIFVGGDYRLKGLVPLIEASRRLGGMVKVLAVGVQPDAALLHVIEREGLDKVVTFVGKTPEVAPLYAAADCFALPTRYDTFSLATLEAMASGLPVVVSRAAGVSELLSPDRDSLILENPDDVDTLTEHLVRLVRDKNLRASLGAQARITAERYSWDEVAIRTLAVYREALVSA